MSRREPLLLRCILQQQLCFLFFKLLLSLFSAFLATSAHLILTLSAQVELNIGGTVFTTTKQTLTSPFAKGSMLEAMFSGRHNIRRNKKGQVFIDRDSTYFRHVLNFLRTGMCLPVNIVLYFVSCLCFLCCCYV